MGLSKIIWSRSSGFRFGSKISIRICLNFSTCKINRTNRTN